MKVVFRTSDAPLPRLVARLVAQDALPGDLDAVVREGAAAARFAGKAGQVFEAFVAGTGGVTRLALAGIGKADAADRLVALEKAGAALTAKYLTSGETSLAIDFSNSGLSGAEAAAILFGARLRGWRHDVYRTRLKDEQKPSLAEIVAVAAPEGAAAAWEIESALAEGVEFTRELVAEPANVIYPESFVERAKARLEGTGVEIVVLGLEEMTRLGMGALLGVAQGSVREPKLLAMRWKGAEADKPTAFVGKGVTFDTGGISIKPAAGMEDMKWDMGGAAAVAGTMLALAKRKAKADVIGVCGLVENMPDGNAQRPGDVVTSMSGQTVEVINTDAEGRLVLCDALTWVQKEYGPRTIVDLATLTGAMIISLGHEYGGLFANDDALAANLDAAGKTSGDKLWRFPLGPAYDKLIDSPIADMKNVGPRYGGSITAAQFLQRYIDAGVAWAHLDIAGMVWADKPGQTWDKGATGYGVRLLDRYVRDVLEA
ncbi:Leucyl aminopeptidase [Novosphingobium aromaticivorans DSM 12444]|uniref:Probable cytosol aminopeptidase n=1 Tax=Novosphingobium aromaticivorans (strain ATCC 700278 / DSM 12444 / CCUG 56034 / CIP 105152 / NBRC 16084 / F199) TaxID=279238 RepID=Q2G9Y8_NOVAD|nr:leucyl aminopeptidase [Novosphingobium aromaticivorans]ABD25335.1 Leucyl aminopeptidase [Novosphingobium aromaticivorans DSM 12444]SCX90337.1 leucyl aminopeptidase [Novosphingobium aromaticivorans]